MTTIRNHLLDSLGAEDRATLAPHLWQVEHRGGARVSHMVASSDEICFPLTFVASVTQVMADGSRFDIGLIGAEGMVGWPAMLGFAPASYAGIVQLSGGAGLSIPSGVLVAACMRSPALQAAMLRFVHSFAVQMSHTIVANLRDGIEARLARWLLMLHDRVDGDGLAVTHDALATALHVRRASITDALHLLEGERVVRCTRGQIAIRDRAALSGIAGDSYGPAETSYRALVGPFGKG